MSIELGSTKVTSSLFVCTIPWKLPGGRVGGTPGGSVVGSGKSGTPCERMHTAIASACLMVAADGGDWEKLIGKNLQHAFWAA
ncbi:MAG: hypothetical protein WB383_01455 [Acidimicrobiales bacterium]